MPTTDWKSPGALSNSGVSGGAWSDPTNAYTSNGQYTTNNASGGFDTQWLRARGFDFSEIPDNAVITSIEVQAEAMAAAINRLQLKARLLDGSFTSSTLYNLGGTLPISPAYVDDSAPDNWGDDSWLNVARVKTNFGCEFQASADINTGVSIDHVRMRITYLEPQAAATGLATETDVALTRGRGSGPGRAIAVETALALGAVQARPVGLASEALTALALGLGLGAAPAAETNEAFALGRAQIIAVRPATEVDSAVSPGVSSSPITPALETDTALALPGVIGVGAASEVNIAIALPGRLVKAVGVAVETDLAMVPREATPIVTPTDRIITFPANRISDRIITFTRG